MSPRVFLGRGALIDKLATGLFPSLEVPEPDFRGGRCQRPSSFPRRRGRGHAEAVSASQAACPRPLRSRCPTWQCGRSPDMPVLGGISVRSSRLASAPPSPQKKTTQQNKETPQLLPRSTELNEFCNSVLFRMVVVGLEHSFCLGPMLVPTRSWRNTISNDLKAEGLNN